MVQIRGQTTITRPLEIVFDFVADKRNEPLYNRRMRRADKVTGGPIGTGTVFRAATWSMGREVEMSIEVTGYERPTRLWTTARVSAAEILGALTFDPDPAGTRLHWSWELKPKGPLRLAGPVIAHMGRRQETMIWTGLKRYLEAPTTPYAW